MVRRRILQRSPAWARRGIRHRSVRRRTACDIRNAGRTHPAPVQRGESENLQRVSTGTAFYLDELGPVKNPTRWPSVQVPASEPLLVSGWAIDGATSGLLDGSRSCSMGTRIGPRREFPGATWQPRKVIFCSLSVRLPRHSSRRPITTRASYLVAAHRASRWTDLLPGNRHRNQGPVTEGLLLTVLASALLNR